MAKFRALIYSIFILGTSCLDSKDPKTPAITQVFRSEDGVAKLVVDYFDGGCIRQRVSFGKYDATNCHYEIERDCNGGLTLLNVSDNCSRSRLENNLNRYFYATQGLAMRMN